MWAEMGHKRTVGTLPVTLVECCVGVRSQVQRWLVMVVCFQELPGRGWRLG